ncbi:hypothetical protein C7C46_17305 [Streptomyces tateyamensis]|uniref:Uncharacterized protein n=1 Tax=Streptomyces tateyamensis TaxID=565073 RepID=A0A2V4N2M2_9ACTN|nr:hypothetical protein [Streptomyces tateyamensis]PYC78086.1 hypothetical protein C7C46_17305 [Streptomyces tateyamensis]
MKRHRFDVFSFLAGTLFTVLGVLYLTASLSGFSVNGRIVLPVTFIVLGAAGLIGAVTAFSRRDRGPGQRPGPD